MEKKYLETGQVMPPPKNFKQAEVSKPRRIIWDITDELENEIHEAVIFSQKVSTGNISYKKTISFNFNI